MIGWICDSKKASMASSGDEFEQTLEQFKSTEHGTSDNKSNYTVQALLAAVVPICKYLLLKFVMLSDAFHSILDLNVLDNFLIYGLVTVTVTFFLSFAFYNVSNYARIRYLFIFNFIS